ncbi:MAG: ABC transporter ATP-binding protein/permease [Leptolyngbyaceae cyanobacterium HOT.MB2.61]|nr:ABC transporter ATP-binding protein/permease [Leptolyngbyaceae cyanobacterium HOT.MB2.61]
MHAEMIRKIAKSDPTQLETETPILQLYGRLLAYVWQYKWAMAGGIASIFALSFLQILIPQITRFVIDVIIPARRFDWLPWVGICIIGIAVLLGLLNFVRNYLMAVVGQRTVFTLRRDLYEHLQALSLSYFENQRTGALIGRLTQDVDSLQGLITSELAELGAEIVTFFVIVTYLFYADWKLTLLILATLPVMVLLTHLFGTRMRPAYREVREQGAELNNHLQDTIANIKIIKACANEAFESGRFAERNQQNMTVNIRVIQLWSAFSPVIDFMNHLGHVIVLVYGSWEVMQDALTVGELAAFLAYLNQVNQPAKKFSRIIHTIQKAGAACERIFETLDEQPDVQEKPDAIALPPIQGHLQFDAVDFAYQADRPVLQQFSLDIQPGMTVALVGPSGAGKSTIANLAVRFYDPQAGCIRLDGQDLRDVTFQSLRSQIGVVSQETLLLYGTVRDNITYGKPDADESALIAAAQAAYAHNFILELPQGYDTVIGERGVKLSGGQRQRLAIARALIKDPKLLLLDEATSSLDTESEHLIQQALADLMRDRTCLVIAHRLSTIQTADLIVVINNGTILERGTHTDLLARGQFYAHLYQLQFPKNLPTDFDPAVVLLSKVGSAIPSQTTLTNN